MDILVWILGVALAYFLIGLLVAWAKATTVGGFEWGNIKRWPFWLAEIFLGERW